MKKFEGRVPLVTGGGIRDASFITGVTMAVDGGWSAK